MDTEPITMDFKQFQQLQRTLRELYPDVKSKSQGVPVAMARCAQAVEDGVMTVGEGRAFRDQFHNSHDPV